MLFSWAEVQQFTGFASSDFQDAGVTMNATQWTAFGTMVVNAAVQAMQRFCNVENFESHAVTEYHNGRGASGDLSDYIESDLTFFLREYATTVATVSENITYGSAAPSWATRWEQSPATFGDYVYWSDMQQTRVRFLGNVPRQGIRNVKIEYTGGYPAGSHELDDLKMIGLRLSTNYLLYKKKIGESRTIRAMGTKDYSPMFSLAEERAIMTEDISRDLCKYRRWDFGGDHIR